MRKGSVSALPETRKRSRDEVKKDGRGEKASRDER